MAKHKILVVDDEESLCEILQFNLEVEGYEADVASRPSGCIPNAIR